MDSYADGSISFQADGLILITLRPVASRPPTSDSFFSDILGFRFTDVVRFPKSGFSVFPPALYAFDYQVFLCLTFKMSRDRGWRASCGSEHEA